MTNTEILRTDHPLALSRAIDILRNGGLIALPTDTVYGIAADAWNGAAVSKLYEIKDRSTLKSIPVLISGPTEIAQIGAEISDKVHALAQTFWPGPLTLVVQRKMELPIEISATNTVGVRAPDHNFVLELLREFGPTAASSANRSGQPSATTAAEVVESFDGGVDLVLDGGETQGGIPSTVVDTTSGIPRVLREGPISLEAVLEIWQSY